jgi:hypothetical protein
LNYPKLIGMIQVCLKSLRATGFYKHFKQMTVNSTRRLQKAALHWDHCCHFTVNILVCR